MSQNDPSHDHNNIYDNSEAHPDASPISQNEEHHQNDSLSPEDITTAYEAPQTEHDIPPVDESAARISLLENELERAKEQMIRALAEAENTRRRAQKDREDATKFAVSGFARDILSVADNLRRALDAIPEELLNAEPQIKNLTDGIEATERELLRCFDKNNIKKIEPLGQPFDPNFHEVMFEAPMPDQKNGTIIQVLEAGYVLNGRILRPARVGISKGGTDNSSAPPSEPGHTLNTEV